MIDETRSEPTSADDPEVSAAPPARRPLSQRPLFKALFILFAAAVMLVLLGLLISPRYWRF